MTGGAWYRFARMMVKEVFFRSLGGLTIKHGERMPRTGRLIVAPVHFSVLDPPLVAAACDRELTFMAKAEIFGGPFGLLCKSLGAFPVHRGEGDSEAIRKALDLLDEDRALLIFPEGTRGDAVTLGAMNHGIIMMSKRTGAPVIPLGFNGTHVIWPKGKKIQRRKHIVAAFGTPITYSDFADQPNPRVAMASELERQLLELTRECGLALEAPKVADAKEGRTLVPGHEAKP